MEGAQFYCRWKISYWKHSAGGRKIKRKSKDREMVGMKGGRIVAIGNTHRNPGSRQKEVPGGGVWGIKKKIPILGVFCGGEKRTADEGVFA